MQLLMIIIVVFYMVLLKLLLKWVLVQFNLIVDLKTLKQLDYQVI